MRNSTGKKRGFTVVELLVVVSIILLLMAIFLPSLKQAELRSQEAVCAADMRTLSQVWIAYATNSFGVYPDLSYERDGTGSMRPNYWSYQSWRVYWEEEWNLDRSVWYSPTNPRWNRDPFYYGGSAGIGNGMMVIGRHSFTGSFVNTSSFHNNMKNTTYSTAPFVPPDEARPLFARRMNQKTFFDIMWSDLCREWKNGGPSANNTSDPKYNFLSPSDPDRWGVNHMYPSRGTKGRIEPYGVHVIRLDGGMQFKLWPDEIHCYGANAGTEYWW